MRDLLPKIFKIFSAQMVAALSLGLIVLLTARYLGAHGRGVIAMMMAYSTIAAKLASMSLGMIVISDNQGGIRRDELWDDFSVAMSYSLLAIVVTLLLTAMIYHLDIYGLFSGISLQDFTIGVLAIPFMLWEEYASNFLSSLNRIGTYNRITVEARLLGLVLISALILTHQLSITGTLWVLLFIRFYAVILGGWAIHRELQRFLTFKLKGLMPKLLDGMKFHLMPLGVLLLTNADVLMVKSFCGLSITGQYQFAAQVTTLILLAIHAVSIVLTSKLSEATAYEIWEKYRGTIAVFMIGIVLLALVCAVSIPPFIVKIAGPGFSDAGNLFLWMLIPMVLKSVSVLFAHQWAGRKLYWQASVATAIVASVNILLALIWIPLYGPKGAILAATIAQIISVTLNFLMIYFSNRWTDSLIEAGRP